jgi:hypothetical protein
MTAIDDPLADDPSHAIPVVGACDIRAVRKNGGADVVVVIASPLQNDDRSRRRIVQKVRNYLGYIASKDFATEHGQPTPQNTSIIFQVHPESDSGVLAFLEECRPWISDNKANLVVKKLANQPAQTTPGSCAPLRV